MTGETDSVDQEDESTSVVVESVTDADAVTGSGGVDRRDRGESVAPKGWRQIATNPDRFVGHYEADGVRMPGGAQRTSSGRYRFYAKSLTETFWKNMHDGQHLLAASEVVDGAYLIIFEERPDSLQDGIESVEEKMVADGREGAATGEDDSDQEDED